MKKVIVILIAVFLTSLVVFPKVLAASGEKTLASKDIWITKNVDLQNKKYSADLIIIAENIKLTNIDVAGNVFIAGSDVKIQKLKAFSVHVMAGNVGLSDIEIENSGYLLGGYLDIRNIRVKNNFVSAAGIAFINDIVAKDVKIGAGNLRISGNAEFVTIVLNKSSIYDIEGLNTKKLKLRQFSPKLKVVYIKKEKSLRHKIYSYLKSLFVFTLSTFLFAEIIFVPFRKTWTELIKHKKSNVVSTTLLGAGLTIMLILFVVLGFLLQHYLHLNTVWFSIMSIGLLLVIYSLLPFLLVVVNALKLEHVAKRWFKNLKIKDSVFIFVTALFLGILYLGPIWMKIFYSTLLFGALGDILVWVLSYGTRKRIRKV